MLRCLLINDPISKIDDLPLERVYSWETNSNRLNFSDNLVIKQFMELLVRVD